MLLVLGMTLAFAGCVLVALAFVPKPGEKLLIEDENILARRRARARESPMVEMLMPAIGLVALRLRETMTPGRRAELAQKLAAAEYPWGFLPEEFEALAWVGAALTFAFVYACMAPLGLWNPVLPGTMAFGAYWLVLFSLNSSIRERQWRASLRIPYALDLMTLTMEAGATFNEAVDQIVRDDPEAPFVRDLAVMQSEIRLGTPRRDALLGLARRVDIEWFHGVVSAILQGEELGVPISEVLRTQANVIRQKRTERAEKIGEEAPVRMVLPTMLVMVSVLLIFMGPAIVRWAKGEMSL